MVCLQNLTDWQETSSAWNFDHLTNNGDTATSTLESTSVAPGAQRRPPLERLAESRLAST